MNGTVRVHFQIVVCLGGPPERRMINNIMGENSKFSARFHYAEDISSFSSSLPSCTLCFRKMQEEPGHNDVDPSCSQCVKWNMMCGGKLYSVDVPRNYPNKKQR